MELHGCYIPEDTTLKEARLCSNSYVNGCLCKWFVHMHSERMHVSGVVMKVQAVEFNRLLGMNGTFKASEGFF